ncbi:MAG: tetratricopeptide repeat protein [Brevinematia bacterium]
MKKIFAYIIITALFLSINLFAQEESSEEKKPQTTETKKEEVKKEEKPAVQSEEQKKEKVAEERKIEETVPEESSSSRVARPGIFFNEKKLLELIETNPKNPQPYIDLIKYYTSKDMRKERLRIAIKYIQNIGGSAYMYQIIGDENRLNGDFSKALISYQYALRLNPVNHAVYNRLGLVHLKLENFNQAEAAFKAAIFFGEGENAYTRSVYYGNLALAYESMNDIENAKKYYKMSLKFNPLNQSASEGLKRVEK